VSAHVETHDEPVSKQLLPKRTILPDHINAWIVPLFPLETAHLRHQGFDAAHLHAVYDVSNLHAVRLTLENAIFAICSSRQSLAEQRWLGH
jgi:hypothetical protein